MAVAPEKGETKDTYEPAPVTMATLFWRRRRADMLNVRGRSNGESRDVATRQIARDFGCCCGILRFSGNEIEIYPGRYTVECTECFSSVVVCSSYPAVHVYTCTCTYTRTALNLPNSHLLNHPD